MIETTKLTLDKVETLTMQASKFAHGLTTGAVIFILSVWIKMDGMGGTVRSLADVPIVLTLILVALQMSMATIIL